MQIKNYNRSKPEILRLLWDIIIFRLVAYLLNMICLNLLLLYKIVYIYMNFRIILTQFYINFSRHEHQIDVLYVYRSMLRFDQVSSYTPFHLSFTVCTITYSEYMYWVFRQIFLLQIKYPVCKSCIIIW